MILNMSLLKLLDRHSTNRVHVMHSYTIHICQRASGLYGSLGTLKYMCVCASSQTGLLGLTRRSRCEPGFDQFSTQN
jgi:hypothetical protein